MDIKARVQVDSRSASLRAYERWKGFQPNVDAMRGAEANRDGSIPRPKVAAVTPEQRARFESREKLREVFDSSAYRGLRVGMERMIGATLDFADLPPNEQALKAGRPVVRLVTMPAAGIVPQGFATGFLIAPELIITNYHVFRTADEAAGSGAQFLYERTQAGIREGVTFALDPVRFFVNDRKMDYAVVAVKTASSTGAPLSQFQFLPLIASKGKIEKGDPVNIIQHPQGGPKEYATVNNQLLDLRDDGFLLYETDTLEGSSGSPVFNQFWETIALHHCGVPRIEDGMLVTKDNRRLPLDAEVADDDLIWIANEGIRVSALVASLSAQRPTKPEQQRMLTDLLANTGDPLVLVTEKSPIIPGTPTIPLPITPEAAMAQNIFNISGPVTIYTGGSAKEPLLAASVPPVTEFPEKTLRFDEDYSDRIGYKPDYLAGWNVPLPTVDEERSADLLGDRSGDPAVFPYYHYSLLLNKARRLLVWAASNVDYSVAGRKFTKSRKTYGGENWRLDPRVALAAPGLQIENADFYAPAHKIDRGHIVRREDGCWGSTPDEAEFGNSDTYHWTNCTPQSEAFNRSQSDGIWGQFEDHIQTQAKAIGGRMSVFAGPVLNPDDPEHGYHGIPPIQVPMEFWKVVVCVSQTNGAPENLAYGFVFDQTEPVQRLGYERMDMTDFEVFQMPLKEITRKTGVVFDQSILDADVLKGGGANESIRGFSGKRIDTLANVVLR